MNTEGKKNPIKLHDIMKFIQKIFQTIQFMKNYYGLSNSLLFFPAARNTNNKFTAENNKVNEIEMSCAEIWRQNEAMILCNG